MKEPRTCPTCRAPVPPDAPEGVCPACALRAGLAPAEPAGPGDAELSEGAIALEELARRLPELEEFELAGEGGMGSVYRARHTRLDRAVAVKVLGRELRDTPGFIERFTREARTLAQLQHPNIVTVYDFGDRDGLTYLVMEFVDGVNLRQMIRAGTLTPKDALAMVPPICEALQYAHDHGVVHRDVKPENVLVDRKGTIKIADFGLAKLVGAPEATRLTRTAQVMGTPSYMAPEQIESPASVDHRADIFALGVVLYELLTGELPVGRFAPPSEKVAVDVRLDEVVLRTLEKEPELRYQKASELQSDVESLGGGPPGAAPASQPQRRGGPPADSVAAETVAKPGYEYRSARTLFGIPLVHIAFSKDPEGKRMRLASGIIAIGDMAIGVVSVGGFAFGVIPIGGISVGLISLGGVSLGLTLALGGVAFGGFAAGGLAGGLVEANGAAGFSLLSLDAAAATRVTLAAWLTATIAFTCAAVAAGYAWASAKGSPEGGDSEDTPPGDA